MLKRLIPIAALTAALALPLQPPAEAITLGDVLRGAIIASQGLFITDADEIRLGQATAQNVLRQMPRVTDAVLNAYVTRIGQQVAAVSDRPNLPYQFFIVDHPEVNAFAAPGGFVFVTTGALRFMQEESQLAGVLAHEVAHVAKKHSVQAIRKALVAQGIASAVLGENQSQLVAIAANLGATIILRGFDRKAELEADQLGALYAYRANYDPRSLPVFLTALGQAHGEPPQWLMPVADHPRSGDRVTQLNRFLAQPGFQTKKTLVIGRQGYQQQVLTRLGKAPNPSPAPTKRP